MQRVKIINEDKNGNPYPTKILVGDNELKGVNAIKFNVTADTIPEFTFDIVGIPDIEMEGHVIFSYSAKNVGEAIRMLRNELLKHGYLYKEMISDIKYALKEVPSGEYITQELAEHILNTAMGLK